MKKYFIKIITISLIVIIFPVANNFCFQGLFDSLSRVSVAQAAASNNVTGSGMDVCLENSIPVSAKPALTPVPLTEHNNSLLPCCVDGNHPNIIVSSQSVEIEKFIPTIFFSDEQILALTFTNPLYYAPIFSPPKLLAVKTTVLRL